MSEKKTFILGNILRGYTQGNFVSIDEAWRILSGAFNLCFPSKSGRSVFMFVIEKNKYGFDDKLLCKSGTTSMLKITEDEINMCEPGYI